MRTEMFLREVDQQCRFAIMAYHDLLEEPRREPKRDRFWFSAEALLIAVANLSKLFWPSRKSSSSTERGRELREMLDVPDDSPLQNRDLRNHFEHFDERLDTLFKDGNPRGILDSNIGIRVNAPKGSPPSVLRDYQPTTGILSFLGEEYHLPTVMNAVSDLQARVAALRSG